MGKKNNTLNDLSKFLESEQINTITTIPAVEKDYFKKKPLSLVSVDVEEVIIKEVTRNEDKPKFVDSKVIQKTSFEDVEDKIKTLALDNNLTVQQVISTLYFSNLPAHFRINFFDWSGSFQKNYLKFWIDLHQNFLKNKF